MSGPLDISLKDKIEFIESLLIPAFDTDNELDCSKKRKEWMRQEANNTNWDVGISTELIKRFGTVKSLEEAEMKLEKAERLLEKAEENERKQGKSSLICSFFIVLHLDFVFSHVAKLCLVLLCLFFRWLWRIISSVHQKRFVHLSKS
jgi:hypothetical protein